MWPPPPPEFRKRAAHSTTLDGLKAAARAFSGSHAHSPDAPDSEITPSSKHSHHHLSHAAHKKGLELADQVEKLPEDDPQRAEQHETQGKSVGDSSEGKGEIGEVIKVKIDGEEVELADQIQLYATNDQVSYLSFFFSFPLTLITLARTACVPLCFTCFRSKSRRSPSSLRYVWRQGGAAR